VPQQISAGDVAGRRDAVGCDTEYRATLSATTSTPGLTGLRIEVSTENRAGEGLTQ
jgi:hypothetical protein